METLLAVVFASGYIANDVMREHNLSVISNAHGEVGDYDFQKAVRYAVNGHCYIQIDGLLPDGKLNAVYCE